MDGCVDCASDNPGLGQKGLEKTVAMVVSVTVCGGCRQHCLTQEKQNQLALGVQKKRKEKRRRKALLPRAQPSRIIQDNSKFENQAKKKNTNVTRIKVGQRLIHEKATNGWSDPRLRGVECK